MVSRVAKPGCRWIGAFFLLLAVLGYFDGPVIGRHGMVAVDAGLSTIHALIGLVLIGFSFGGESMCAFGLYITAGTLVAFAAGALYSMGTYDSARLIDALTCTRSAAYFHLAAAVILGITGKMNTASKQLFRE
jgi:hypothetical protein